MPRKIALPREIAGVRFPDSVLAQKAVDLAFRVSPAVVWNHVLRTFVFGVLVGKAQSLRYDEELFFLASVLHDLGLTAEFRGAKRFEVVGADAADAFLKDQGVNPERREIIWDAIAFHTSVGIASRKRPEIALVHIGAGVDVIGLELDRLPPAVVAETIEAFPPQAELVQKGRKTRLPHQPPIGKASSERGYRICMGGGGAKGAPPHRWS
jgi:hypothetical protein